MMRIVPASLKLHDKQINMIYSMTGYGRGSAVKKNLTAEVEVKTVNSRFLDIYLKVPPSLLNKEYEIREFIRTKIKRGKVSVISQIKMDGLDEELLSVDTDKIRSYMAMLKQIKKTAKLTEKIKLDHLLVNRELFISTNVEYSEDEFLLLKEALEKALNQLLDMKRNEGKELAKDLKKRVGIIEERLNTIESLSESSVKEYFEKLKEKVKALVENIAEYSDRLELEVALIADRAEITEECVRLRSHIKFFVESLDKDDEPGRKLNFLCQEMNREANTITSKSVSTPINHNSVLIKEEIEKIREQIQNIE